MDIQKRLFRQLPYNISYVQIKLVVIKKPSQSPIRDSHYYWDRKQLIRGVLLGLTNCKKWPY